MDRIRFAFAAFVTALCALLAPLSSVFAAESPERWLESTYEPVQIVTLDDRTPGPWHARARESAEFRASLSWGDYMAKSCAMTAALVQSGKVGMLPNWDCADPVANWPNPVKGATIAVPTEPSLAFVPDWKRSSDGTLMAAAVMPEVAARSVLSEHDAKGAVQAAPETEIVLAEKTTSNNQWAIVGVLMAVLFAGVYSWWLRHGYFVWGTPSKLMQIADSREVELVSLKERHAALLASMTDAQGMLETEVYAGQRPIDINVYAERVHGMIVRALAADHEEAKRVAGTAGADIDDASLRVAPDAPLTKTSQDGVS